MQRLNDGHDDGEPDAVTRTPQPGDILSGKYILARVLGEGGMGIVFEAIHTKLRQRVAIKVLHPDALAMPDAAARFEREARATGRVRSPHVAHVIDVDTTAEGLPFMVMELLEGRDLEAELRDRRALPMAEAVDYVLQACAAVSAAHAVGIVHRDLKPSNLFLAEQNGRRVVKVLDFGISKMTDDDGVNVSTACLTVGTPMYMSPEQVRSSTNVDGRTDVWSLGVILYEMLAGEPPFMGTTTAAIAAIVADATPSIRERHPHVPRALERAILTALAKRADDRFESVDAFAAALTPFASEDGLSGPFSYRPSLITRASVPPRAPLGPDPDSTIRPVSLLGTPSRAQAQAVVHVRRSPWRLAAGALAAGVAIASASTILVARSVDKPSPAAASAAALSPERANAQTPATPREPISMIVESPRVEAPTVVQAASASEARSSAVSAVTDSGARASTLGAKASPAPRAPATAPSQNSVQKHAAGVEHPLYL